METIVANSTLLWLGLAVGAAFGAIAQKTHFCTMGAVGDIVNMGDWTRMRMSVSYTHLTLPTKRIV